MAETDPFQQQREQMVSWQMQRRGITQSRLLDAFRRIPRHLFVPPEYQSMAYEDHPLPIGCGQTISQPYIVAFMTNLLNLTGSERVLEVGAGSGYQAAILGCLAAEVHSLELYPQLAESANQRLHEIGLSNVLIHCGDGSQGWPAAAPYDGMLITAAAPRAPQPLLEQLTVGGSLILPVGGQGSQVLQRWQRRDGGWEHAFGWGQEDWPG
jgi:protein-L-isoaspartate(D-aspartate) O-methyltransferase